MPVTPTYPGVYIEEISSGVRTITGVATSITAFVGRALRGPLNEPITINSYADFESTFGGLWADYMLGYAVRDFYLNGGSQAIIVRVAHLDDAIAANNASSASLALPCTTGTLNLAAANPGSWGNYLRARVDLDVSQDVADRLSVQKTELFNLTVADTKTGTIEQFRNVTTVDSARRIDKVLENNSDLVRLSEALPAIRPVVKAHADPAAGKTIWEDDTASEKVASKGSDGDLLIEADFDGQGKEEDKKGLYALKKADLFNILCIPPYKLATDGWDIDAGLAGKAAVFCEDHRAMLLVDPLSSWNTKKKAKADVGTVGTTSKNAALFFPRLYEADPMRQNQVAAFVPCGAVAGIFARTDTQRGVWKAPAGLSANLVGVPELSVSLTDAENGELNPLAVNCLRNMPGAGRVVWGARTLQGNDRLASEWKYIPVRRTALFIEESLYRGTQWVVFEPNDEPLWAQIRLSIGAFMHNLFRQGAFQGKSPQEAYFVKCDKETTPQNMIDLGIVNIVVGFAPLKPAEFVIIRIQQMAGLVEV
jgi:hypothetical protein